MHTQAKARKQLFMLPGFFVVLKGMVAATRFFIRQQQFSLYSFSVLIRLTTTITSFSYVRLSTGQFIPRSAQSPRSRLR